MLNGLILAGGQSRRMGQDKALMYLNGKTLLANAEAQLKAAGCQRVLISRNGPGFIRDIVVDGGPLAGVHAALREPDMNGELLVLPVDMPQMTPAVLKTLCDAGREHGRACYVGGRMLPFYLPVNEEITHRLHHFLTVEKERKVVRFLSAIDAIVLGEGDDAALWLNVNSPRDWPNEI
ncbi:molybdenum cofactor guanylyltransferase [Aestuariibacter sp. A3R04]|uniref:molybdenum cofactor guanylyltransferase n=1 Tax=Aestuariibacter sp. A3R04 TaxID=2841571 RepID=UPI0020913B29|nr:molybdenum cofactor guanylyltransferase [Aestuariibacter sp. A3R04]